MKNKIISLIIMFAIFWFFITINMQIYKCANLTRTELVLRTPNSFVLDFIECK